MGRDTGGYTCKPPAVNIGQVLPLSMDQFISGKSMSTEAHGVSHPTRSAGTVPRAVWVGGGLLGLVTASLAGALIMRSVEPAPTPSATATAVADVATQPAPLPSPASAKPRGSAKPATPRVAAAQPNLSTSAGTTSAALCTSCGIVESVNAVQEKGQGTGLGAVAGGVLGGVVGHQVGGGNGKTAMTVLGAIGGGLAGNEVEKRARSETRFDVNVRMEDGSTRVFHRAQSLSVGTHVVVEGSTLRVARDAGNSDEPRVVGTAGGSS
jgi:outer membrane lipoprotein SlyB